MALIMSKNKLTQWIPFGKVPGLFPQDIENSFDDSEIQILDVRTQQEWHLSHIPGAINLPITSFSKTKIDALNLDKDKKTVAICLSAHRSIPAVRQLQEMGFKDCLQLEGGMLAWWKMDLPTNTKRKANN